MAIRQISSFSPAAANEQLYQRASVFQHLKVKTFPYAKIFQSHLNGVEIVLQERHWVFL
jgi:hypothetical protein